MMRLIRHRDGFTLVELLVVISIIVVLLALLAPALERAISEAERVVCLSNERVIGVAIGAYASDYKGHFPHGIPPLAAEELYIPVIPWPKGSKPPHQVLVPYTAGVKPFYCPTDPDPGDFGWWAYNDYPDFFELGAEGRPHDAQRDIIGTPAATLRGPGKNLGASYMFSQQAALEIRPYKLTSLKGFSSNLGYLADGRIVVNGWSWATVDARDPSISPNYWSLRVAYSHLDTISFLMADFSAHSVIQYTAVDGRIRERVRSDPHVADLPQ
jgi:prepilin-type N-terminal cleavage/methylation domain-containing protein